MDNAVVATPYMGFISWLVLGLIAGFIGSKIVNRTGEGFLLDIVLGVVGAIVGGYLFTLGNVSGTPAASYNFVASPVGVNQTGVRYFCSFADAVVRSSSASIGATSCDGTVNPLQ